MVMLPTPSLKTAFFSSAEITLFPVCDITSNFTFSPLALDCTPCCFPEITFPFSPSSSVAVEVIVIDAFESSVSLCIYKPASLCVEI